MSQCRRLRLPGACVFSKRDSWRVWGNNLDCSLLQLLTVAHVTDARPTRRGLAYQKSIDPKSLIVEKTANPKTRTPSSELVFGRTFSDHMLEVDWDAQSGWHSPKISPFHDFQLSPATMALHYGVQCFEGMKAYKDKAGKTRLFRPEKNMQRLNYSMARLGMPSIAADSATASLHFKELSCPDGSILPQGDFSGLLECIKELLRVDDRWIPTDGVGYSIYLRPTAIGMTSTLGVAVSDKVKVFVILCPVGPYHKSGFAPVKLFADHRNVRAWPGGAGNAKLGGNYAPTLAPARDATAETGSAMNLWLFGPDHEITEVGAMNIFFLLRSSDSSLEFVTPTLKGGDILPGVTRDSILSITRGWQAQRTDGGDQISGDKLTVSERKITMKEVTQAHSEGRLLEAFGAGTGVVISPVKCISYMGVDLALPTGDKDPGMFTRKVWNELMQIQYGEIEDHPWSIII